MSVLEMKGITKSFGSVKVLESVDLRLESGEVLALLGENGAGKSTLMKILTGVYSADAGEIRLDGQPVSIHQIQDSRALGIEIMHQELSLFQNLSIAENFLIGHEAAYRTGPGLIDYRKLHRDVAKALLRVGLQRPTSTPVSALGVGEQQLVEIARAIQSKVRFLIMDEPTAALTEVETARLFDLIRQLRADGVGIIYISHRMEELYQIADKVEILRDGKFIGTRSMAGADERELIRMMVGRDVDERYPRRDPVPGEMLLELKGLTTHRVRNIHLNVRAGEVVGLGGLMGSGRTEVARAIAGVDRIRGGEMRFRGQPRMFRSPGEASAAGVAFVTEDRKREGLILSFSVRENLALPTLDQRKRGGLVHRARERAFANDMVHRLRIKVANAEQAVGSLSGGNQQKVVLGKWLAHNPDLLILDEPTRGVDVGAKQEIYQLINEMKAEGKGILMISSDLPELLGMCDRVYVMYQGTTQGEVKGESLNEEDFMTLATGGEL
ncbi:ribose import ATP-binding protein RbsA [Alicyclobacillus contaminans]|uniref:sugar ABC transporter ATP-binding protein n=1 Tax=Alicyclobacillus contaminans TaxID=392016 RepID=UPI0004144ABE|nr:sugar ABC transporter ATP-binding protein [Alicyclobacillus contaminans]GMA51384.1 ribose import ATP-binding protein RbsA [Alicyclobacillus contaminans]